MKMKMDDVLVYKDSQLAVRYGTGVVTGVTPAEYTILWSGRGLTKYRRSILDRRLEQTFQQVETQEGLPKERRLQLGTANVRVVMTSGLNVEQECLNLGANAFLQKPFMPDELISVLKYS